MAGHVLHHDEVLVLALVEPEVEDLDDVGMHQPGGGQGLAAEARDEGRVVGQVLGQQLQGDIALQPLVEGQVDGGHAADAQPALDPVAAGDHVIGHRSSSGGPAINAGPRACPCHPPPEPPPSRRVRWGWSWSSELWSVVGVVGVVVASSAWWSAWSGGGRGRGVRGGRSRRGRGGRRSRRGRLCGRGRPVAAPHGQVVGVRALGQVSAQRGVDRERRHH